jgi:hypothetical protein
MTGDDQGIISCLANSDIISPGDRRMTGDDRELTKNNFVLGEGIISSGDRRMAMIENRLK